MVQLLEIRANVSPADGTSALHGALAGEGWTIREGSSAGEAGGECRRRGLRSCRPGPGTERGSSRLPSTWPGRLRQVSGGVLGGLQLAYGLADVTSDLVGVDLDGLDHAFRVDHEGTAQGQAFFRDVHAEGVGQLVGRVADQRELGLADGREVSCQTLCEKWVSVVTM